LIKEPTVFVLGAGVSAPYGFPLGASLVASICDDLDGFSVLYGRVQELGFDLSHIRAFRNDLAVAGRASIDAFLEKRKDYLAIGKACIAATLIPCEHEDELTVYQTSRPKEVPSPSAIERQSRRWYHYLFEQMLTGGEFGNNQLTVITFNFDRSFERAMYNVVRVHYPGDADAIRRICKQIQVIHVHGRLGAPEWLEPSDSLARPYGCPQLLADDIKICAEDIRLVTDEISPKVTRGIREALDLASTSSCAPPT
jgi:hypothetical protein